ncbi:MAG TPA: M24 family metallopeptidase [Actinomycetota bacterium]
MSGYFPLEEYEDRWRRLGEEMRRQGFRAALVWSRSAGGYEKFADVFYLTHYYSNQSGQADEDAWLGVGFAAAIVTPDEAPELIADLPTFPEDAVATDRIDRSEEPNRVRLVCDAMRARGLDEGPVALVGDHFLPWRYARVLQAELPGVEWIPADELVEAVRRHKSPRELDCIREGGEIVTAALTKQLERALDGGTQADIAAAGAHELLRRGGNFHMIPVASGTGVSLEPFTNEPLTGFDVRISVHPGDLVRTWIYGPAWQGYWLDPGRTLVVGGRPSPSQRALISAANDLVTRLIEEIRPGRSVREVAALGARLRAEAGSVDSATSETFPLLGHGNGLFWERPTIWLDVEENEERWAFWEGETMGVETFLTHPGVGTAGVEQNIIVQEGGNELLTTVPLEWW